MYLKMKDCDEPLFGEGHDPDSEWGLIFDGAVNVYGSCHTLILDLKILFQILTIF